MVVPQSAKALVQMLAGWFLHACSPLSCVFPGHFDFLPQSKDVLCGLIGVTELPRGVHVSVWPGHRLVTCLGSSLPSPNTSFAGSSNPVTTRRIQWDLKRDILNNIFQQIAH